MPAYEGSRGRWRFRCTYQGKRYSGSAPKGNNTKKAALALERDLLERLMARRFTGVMPLVKDFIRRFLDYQKAHTKQLTHELHETICTLHIEPHVGKLRLDQLRRGELEGLKMARLDVVAMQADDWRARGERMQPLRSVLGDYDWESIKEDGRLPEDAERKLIDAMAYVEADEKKAAAVKAEKEARR